MSTTTVQPAIVTWPSGLVEIGVERDDRDNLWDAKGRRLTSNSAQVEPTIVESRPEVRGEITGRITCAAVVTDFWGRVLLPSRTTGHFEAAVGGKPEAHENTWAEVVTRELGEELGLRHPHDYDLYRPFGRFAVANGFTAIVGWARLHETVDVIIDDDSHVGHMWVKPRLAVETFTDIQFQPGNKAVLDRFVEINGHLR